MTSRFPIEFPDANPERHLHRQTAQLGIAAHGVLFGGKTMSDEVFPPIPFNPQESDIEPGGTQTNKNNILFAFSSALYAYAYGPASEPSIFKVRSSDTVGKALTTWDSVLGLKYRSTLSPAAFKKLFFEGKFGKVFMDPSIPELEAMRDQFDLPNSGGLQHDEWMISMMNQSREIHFTDRQYPHFISHIDAARFINSVLGIGYRELGIRKSDEAEHIVHRNLSELRRIATLSTLEMDVISSYLVDGSDPQQFRRETFTVDEETGEISFNDTYVLDMIEKMIPKARLLKRRGCPVLYQKTKFQGEDVPVFNVLDATLLRIYRETGAFTAVGKRKVA